MSTNTHLFESGLATPPATTCLETLIREHLDRASQDVDMKEPPPSPPSEASSSSSPTAGALVNEMGDYLARTAILWSRLTENLTKGPHIDRAALEVHEISRQDTKIADLSAVAAIDVGLGRLRKIRDLTAQFSNDVQAIWHSKKPVVMNASPIIQASVSPYYDASSVTTAVSGMSDRESRIPKSRRLLPDNASSSRGLITEISETDNSEEEEDDDDDNEDHDEEQFASIDMEALKQRGKGTYYCPKGLRCDKGGVDKDGNLVIFDRNSSFAQHCNKHRKPWRCDVPGCPNPPKKRRFARRDGLERHKTTVKHFPVT